MKLAIHPEYELWTLRKIDSSNPKNVLQNTNEHTCDYVSFPIFSKEALFDFEGNILHRKIAVMNSLYACNFIKSDSKTGAFV